MRGENTTVAKLPNDRLRDAFLDGGVVRNVLGPPRPASQFLSRDLGRDKGEPCAQIAAARRLEAAQPP